MWGMESKAKGCLLAGGQRAILPPARNPPASRTVHLVEPAPLTVRRALELVTERAGTRPPRGFIPARLARALLRPPLLSKLTRAPAAALDLFATPVTYDQTAARELLAGTAAEHPRFEDYVGNLSPFIREQFARRRATGAHDDDGGADPLA